MNERAQLTAEQELEICELYERVECARLVTEQLGIKKHLVYRTLSKHGIPRTHRHPKPEPKTRGSNHKGINPNKVVELYQAGRTQAEIANELDCSQNAVYYHLKKQGVNRKQRTKLDASTIDEIERKYLAGASSYDLSKEYGVDRGTISEWMRKRGHNLGKGSKSDKGGKALALIHLQKRTERFSTVADKVELLESVNKDHNKVRCLECGTVYNWHGGSWTIDIPCPTCRERAKAHERQKQERDRLYKEAAREWLLSTPRFCKECGDTFYSEYENAVYCCDKCRKRAKNRRDAERRKRRGTARGYRHRMRIAVTPETYNHDITLSSVYKKFGGVCCECGRKTRRTKKYAPDMATLDHIIALANNGTHTWDNVQLLCATCNSNKRDLGQMRLSIAI